MNKRPVSRHQELEKELLGNIVDKQVEMGTGHFRAQEDNRAQRGSLASNRGFQIKMGTRRRHPGLVLHNFNTITNETRAAKTSWEKAFQYEDDRQEWDEIYQPKGVKDMMSNQMGLATTALDNFKKSKEKLTREVLVG